jgi:nucleotide-binding universal stress UspA family protein
MLLAVDGSENCRRAVDYVGAFAAAAAAEVTLFSVVRDFKLQLLDVSTPRGEEIEIKLLEEVERDICSMFDSYRKRLEQAGVKGTRISIKHKLRSQTRAGDILPIPMKSPCDSESFRQSEPNHCATPIVGAERRYDYVIFQSLSC